MRPRRDNLCGCAANAGRLHRGVVRLHRGNGHPVLAVEDENGRLKSMVTDQALDHQILKAVLARQYSPPVRDARWSWECLGRYAITRQRAC
jgi:hypothetical protein